MTYPTTAQEDKSRGWRLVGVGLAFVVLALAGGLGMAGTPNKWGWTIGGITSLIGSITGLLVAITGLLKVIAGMRKQRAVEE